jgi:hypothetical protein
MAARGRAFQHPLHDALADAGYTEEVVCHAELPDAGLDRRTPRASTVGGDVFRLTRNPEGQEVESLEATGLAGGNAPEHHMIGKIGERMAEGRKLPVDDCEHAWRVPVEDQVVEPIVAMHQYRLIARRDVGG